MIVSHKHRFIFIKTKKTAGTSIEIALSTYCGENDIITPISPDDEKTREHLNGLGPQNHKIPFSCYNIKDWARLVIKSRRARFYNHNSAKYIRDVVGKEVWNNYYKFCFDRDPYEKVISFYYWLHKTEPRPSIDDFVKNELRYLLPRWGGRDLYTIGNEVVVDDIFSYEDISSEIVRLSSKLSIPSTLNLPNAKSFFRKDRSPAKNFLSPESISLIKRFFPVEVAQSEASTGVSHV